MPEANTAIFVINLVQDISVLRPLVFMAGRDLGFRTVLLVSSSFQGRDMFGIWQKELDLLCEQVGATQQGFADDLTALDALQGQGAIFSASESHLPNHATTHSLFRIAPPGFFRVTVQHGFECIGFRHSADHDRAHGRTASFGADILCSWFGPERLTAMAPSQFGKLLVTGPTSVLQMPSGDLVRDADAPGIVCENLHSVRLNGAPDLKTEFAAVFSAFCSEMESDGRKVTLRPHPGGQYVIRNKLELPGNARLNLSPMYRLDFRRYAYGISAPSSVLIDMLLAGIPTAVWQDRRGTIDAASYAGLTTISTVEEWAGFARAATTDPEPFIQRQQAFMERQGMPLDPRDVYGRFAGLFSAVGRLGADCEPRRSGRDE